MKRRAEELSRDIDKLMSEGWVDMESDQNVGWAGAWFDSNGDREGVVELNRWRGRESNKHERYAI